MARPGYWATTEQVPYTLTWGTSASLTHYLLEIGGGGQLQLFGALLQALARLSLLVTWDQGLVVYPVIRLFLITYF